MKIAQDIGDIIGNTPIIKLKSGIYGKCEFLNPTSSVKDRIGLSMIKEALNSGTINKDTNIIEPTSGNTGIALACICANFGLNLTLTMPSSMSKERRVLLKALGAKLILTDPKLGMKGAIDEAYKLKQKDKNSIILQQFENQANPKIHEKTTALEILEDMSNHIDIFVSAVGTGGTISGVSKVLKKFNPDIKIVAVEPKNSAVISGEAPSAHKIQGIGAGFVPKNLNTSIIDEIVKVDDTDAITQAKDIAKSDGLIVGISSGANIFASLKMQQKYPKQKIVTMLCDTGERYISTGLYD